MAQLTLTQLQANFDRVVTEAGETGDQVRTYIAAIDDLKSQIPSPEIVAQLETISTGLGTVADGLDALQEHAEVPPVDEPPVDVPPIEGVPPAGHRRGGR